jgi:flagellar assembly protein FliH
MSRPSNEPASELIRAEDLRGFDVWSLPSFDPAQPEPEPEPELIEEIEEVPLDEVQPLTLEELESIRQEAYNEGFAVGEREGFHSTQLKVRQEAEVALEARLATLQQLMTHLFLPIAEQDAQIEKSLVELVGHIAREVIQRELTIDSAQIETVLRESLKLLPMGANNVRIFVNPQDFVQVKALRERHEENWRILEDPALLPGGCRVETEHSRIDATIETRITQAIAMMFGQLHEQGMHPAESDMDIDLAAIEAQHLQSQAQARTAAAQARQTAVAEPEPAVQAPVAPRAEVLAEPDVAIDAGADTDLDADLAKLEADLAGDLQAGDAADAEHESTPRAKARPAEPSDAS